MGLKSNMGIISKRTLILFWKIHPDAEQPLKSWHERY
jgi:mRNA-degrading endonuclease HigB of HigAB toxin-antitoxin module